MKESEFIPVTHTTYITFVHDEIAYYFQIEENSFFPFYYSKTPVRNGKFSKDACLDEFSKEWLYDCFFKSGVNNNDIIRAANTIFEMLKKADFQLFAEINKQNKLQILLMMTGIGKRFINRNAWKK